MEELLNRAGGAECREGSSGQEEGDRSLLQAQCSSQLGLWSSIDGGRFVCQGGSRGSASKTGSTEPWDLNGKSVEK